jgi:2-methylaconitate cis-trans-isomerase PrpF
LKRWEDEEQMRIPFVLMRGGTSKAVFLKENHIPAETGLRDKVIRAIYGSPDPRQVDGLGGGDPLTSKLAIIGPPSGPDADVNYMFGQVSPASGTIDYTVNCGNISSAVGPFAIEEGFVKPVEPVTEVRIYNTNTQKYIIAEVPVRNGRPLVTGDFSVDGVPGTGARIMLNFLDSGGAGTGNLLPTGRVRERFVLSDGVSLEVSVVDAGNVFVFIRAEDVGLEGIETPAEIDGRPDVLGRLEEARSILAQMLGKVQDWKDATRLTPASPKVAVVAVPQDYRTIDGRDIDASQISVTARMMALQKTHKAYAVTGAICVAAAANIEGTVVNEVAAKEGATFRLGHPSGTLELDMKVEKTPDGMVLTRASLGRTARRIAEGYVRVPVDILRS